MSLRYAIEEERKALGLSANEFGEVVYYKYENILKDIWNRFTKLGHKAKNHFWINYSLAGEVVGYHPDENEVTAILAKILPKKEIIWFIGADKINQMPKYWLYEATVESALKILDNMYLFDFYLVNKKFKWLVSEEHHGVLLAVGEPVASKLAKTKIENS